MSIVTFKIRVCLLCYLGENRVLKLVMVNKIVRESIVSTIWPQKANFRITTDPPITG